MKAPVKCKCGKHELTKAGRRRRGVPSGYRTYVDQLGNGKSETHEAEGCRRFERGNARAVMLAGKPMAYHDQLPPLAIEVIA